MSTPSASSQDYLEAILTLTTAEHSGVRSVDIAQYLGVSRASVSRAMSVLKEAGYIQHEHYGLITLTPTGHSVAKRVLVRHQVLKSFLVDILGLDDAIAEEDACKMEHVISENTMESLIAYLERQTKAL